MPSDTVLNAVQAAIFITLTADSTLTAKVTGIYDFVPESTAMPYVVIGDDEEVPYNTFGREGREVIATVHVWSKPSEDPAVVSSPRGWKQANSIISDLMRLLDFPAVPLAPSGWPTTPISIHEQTLLLRDPDGISRHGVCRFRIYAEQ